jgi:hypothetical protein
MPGLQLGVALGAAGLVESQVVGVHVSSSRMLGRAGALVMSGIIRDRPCDPLGERVETA